MELKELLTIFRRWAWLLLLGLLVGLLGGYLASRYMEPVYESSTKLMISRSIQNDNPDIAGLNSQQLVQTYVQILNTKPLRDVASEKVGAEIDPKQVAIQQITETQIIEIKVEDHDSEKAAEIANTLVAVLIEQNEDVQTGQYTALESRLTKQVDQVKTQIDSLQTEYDQAIEADYQDQLKLVEDQLAITQDELLTLQSDMSLLRPDWRPEDKVSMAEMQVRADQLQAINGIYEEIRANLLVLGRPYQYSNLDVAPRLQQLQSTLNLYQELYLNLVGELESVRLARLQQTPTIVQIEMAGIPENPVRPVPLLYTLLSGVAGLMFALVLIFFIEALRNDSKRPEPVSRGSEPWVLEPPDVPNSEERAVVVQSEPEEKLKKLAPAAKKPRRAAKAAKAE